MYDGGYRQTFKGKPATRNCQEHKFTFEAAPQFSDLITQNLHRNYFNFILGM